eukprot:jgi/Tetstr1/463781/TSEL_008597.t1
MGASRLRHTQLPRRESGAFRRGELLRRGSSLPGSGQKGGGRSAPPSLRAADSDAPSWEKLLGSISEALSSEGRPRFPVGASYAEDTDNQALKLTPEARAQLQGLTNSILGYSRAYQALFAFTVADTGVQLIQRWMPGMLQLVTQEQYSWMLNSTALVNYWLCFYFLRTCGMAFSEITAGEEKEDSLPDILKSIIYLTLTCNELTVLSWLFTLALTIEAAMIWDGTKYFVGGMVLVFAFVRLYGYSIVNKYYDDLSGFVKSVLRDSKKPVQVDMNMSRTEQILLKINLGPLAMLGLEDQSKVMDTAIDVDGGYRFSEEDLELFRSLSTSMFATGVSYLVATSVTAVYYGAAVAVGDDAEVVSVLYSIPEYLSQLLTGVLLLETTDSFVSIVNGRPYISQFMTSCAKLDNVFLGLTNVTAAIIIGDIFDLFWGDEFTDQLATLLPWAQ